MFCCVQKGYLLKNLNEIINDLVFRIFAKYKIDINTIEIDDFDLDRVYINNDEYTLRMWNIYRDGNVEYTLYKTVDNGGLSIGSGKIRSSKRLVELLQKDAEQKYLEYYNEHNKE